MFAAGGEGNQELDRPIRPVLGVGAACESNERKEGEGCAKKTLARRVSAMVFHGRTIRRRIASEPSPQARMADLHATDDGITGNKDRRRWRHGRRSFRHLHQNHLHQIRRLPFRCSSCPFRTAARRPAGAPPPWCRRRAWNGCASRRRATRSADLAMAQAQPGTVMGSWSAGFRLFKRPAELFARRRARMRCRILDARSPRRQRDTRPRTVMRPLLGGEFDRVGQKVRAILLERTPVGFQADAGAILERTSRFLSCARVVTTRSASLSSRSEFDVLQVELETAGLNLRHIEHVVDDVEQYSPLR